MGSSTICGRLVLHTSRQNFSWLYLSFFVCTWRHQTIKEATRDQIQSTFRVIIFLSVLLLLLLPTKSWEVERRVPHLESRTPATTVSPAPTSTWPSPVSTRSLRLTSSILYKDQQLILLLHIINKKLLLAFKCLPTYRMATTWPLLVTPGPDMHQTPGC